MTLNDRTKNNFLFNYSETEFIFSFSFSKKLVRTEVLSDWLVSKSEVIFNRNWFGTRS